MIIRPMSTIMFSRNSNAVWYGRERDRDGTRSPQPVPTRMGAGRFVFFAILACSPIRPLDLAIKVRVPEKHRMMDLGYPSHMAELRKMLKLNAFYPSLCTRELRVYLMIQRIICEACSLWRSTACATRSQKVCFPFLNASRWVQWSCSIMYLLYFNVQYRRASVTVKRHLTLEHRIPNSL